MQSIYDLIGLPEPAASPAARQKLDENLVQSIAAGDRRAMEVLFCRHNTRVYRFVLRMTKNPALSEDVTSDVFLEVWRRAGAFKAKSQVTTWLLAIAYHKAVSALRRRRETRLDPLTQDAVDAVADPGDDAETALAKRDRGEIVRQCIGRLSPAHRAIIDLVYYHGKSVTEVASIVGAPPNTVKTRMFYARSHMAKMLAAQGIREPESV
jgi:RNA polymerase sigma-70 factor (ECF subfamily)